MTPRTLTKKILFWMGIIGLVPLVIFVLATARLGRDAFVESEKRHLSYALKSRLIWLQEWLHFTGQEFLQASNSNCSQGTCPSLPRKEKGAHQCKTLQSLNRGHARYQSIAIIDLAGAIVSQASQEGCPTPLPSHNLMNLLKQAEGLVISQDYLFEAGKVVVEMGIPSFNAAHERVSYVVARMDITNSLNRILGNANDLGKSGKMFLVTSEGVLLWYPSSSPVAPGIRYPLPPELLQGKSDRIVEYSNQQGVNILAVSAELPDMKWVLVTELNEDEAFVLLYRAFFLGGLAGVASLLVLSVLALRSSRYISRPVEELAQIARNISQGKFRVRVPQFPQKEAEDLSRALNHMLDRLEASHRSLLNAAALAAVGELSSSIVHEMRNPLSSIKLNLQGLANKGLENAAHAEMAAIAIEQTQRLEKILADLLDYSKPLKLSLEETSFSHLLDQTLRAVEAIIREKEIVINVDDHLGDSLIKVDKELMTRALINLVDNAVVWSSRGGVVHVSANFEPINNYWITIRVHDYGPGITTINQEKIFRPFFTTRKNGTGLGLANVKKIIEYHGGMVTATNDCEGGAVFSLLFPVGDTES